MLFSDVHMPVMFKKWKIFKIPKFVVWNWVWKVKKFLGTFLKVTNFFENPEKFENSRFVWVGK